MNRSPNVNELKPPTAGDPQTALANTADFIYLFDLDGRFTFVNKALLDLWGKDLSEAVGKNFFELDYPHDLAERLQRQIQNVISTGQVLRDETPYTSAAGTESYEYIFVPVFARDGSVEAVAGSTRQITARKQNEEALREKEERYRALVNATSDVIYRMSADWSEMQPLDGRDLVASSTEPLRNWMGQNIPPFEHERVKGAFRKAIANKEVFQLEHQVIRADGSLGWTFSRAIPVQDSNGNLVEWFGAASDVTRRKNAEEALHDISSRMQAALSAGAIGTWSWDVQSDLFYGDSSMARMFALSESEVDGGHLSQIMLSIHPDDRERVGALIAKALESGYRYEADYRVTRPDGTWRWVTARGQVERDDAGRPTRFPGVVIDITDWKHAQEDLARVTEESQRRKRLYETILSNTPDFAYVIGLDHRFVYANDTLLQMWGKSWDEAIGKTFIEIGYEPWHAEMHEREVDIVKETRKPLRGEVPFNGTFGRRIYDYIFVPVFGADGEVEAVAGTTRDVTEKNEAEETLREADRKKDDFIALLAHELRNPLAPIRNGLQVMRLAADDPASVAQAREMMDRQLSHMVRLIDDLLDVSRITRNKMDLRRGRTTLEQIVSSAVEAAGLAVQESGHELIVSLPPESITLNSDLTRLAQVVSNLLTNSAKYTPRGGRIWLSAQRTGGKIEITVKDTGIGIPAHALPYIFDLFSQVDRSVERSSGGLGIGLAQVKGLVEMHGGTVSAESVEDQGSTFTVTLPIEESLPPAAEDNETAELSRSPLRKVLVVDDNHDGAVSMSMMLKLMGYEVSMAHDGREAITLAERFLPDYILMDIGLPIMSGFDATREILNRPWGANMKIIAVTGWGQENDRKQSQLAGCRGHLVKPVEFNDLQRLLREESY